MALLDKMSKCKRIPGDISRCEALVGHVEEDEMFTRFDGLREFSPVVLSGVDSRWVVGASVQQDLR